ncbi:Protein GrpE [Chlamydiales bacterium STE3]|nr:Protein GrpE [Chlamydiales bacterium STE3]
MTDEQPKPQEHEEGTQTPSSSNEEMNEADSLKNELAEYKDKYLRLLAEMENSRKRMQKERQEMGHYAIEKVISEFLTPIDHMENALKFTQDQSDEVKHWGLGFQMILTQFKDVLASHGVKSFDSEGHPFDPHIHEAVETVEESQYEPGIVVKEFMRGYKMGEKTIRPARVQVAK